MINYCPFCGKQNIEHFDECITEEGFQNEEHFHCNNCVTDFTVDEIFL